MVFRLLHRAWHRRDVERRIKQHGWTGVYVGDYESSPTWTYSIGFEETLNQPELIVFDITQEAANQVLWEAHEELKRGTLVLEDGKPWPGDDPERPMVWRKVHPSQIESADGWFALAAIRRMSRTGQSLGLEAFQLVMSDETGRLPWQDGYNEKIRHRQPALYVPAHDYGQASLSPPEREALRIADERGWSLMLVRGPGLNWAYSIGLAEVQASELISFLPTADLAANILHDAQDWVARGELVLRDGLRWDGLGFECCWRRVHESQYLALNVCRLTKLRHEQRTGRREAVEAYQLFLPDKAGRYPWEPGCDKPMRDLQPLLFEPFDPDQLKRRPLAALERM